MKIAMITARGGSKRIPRKNIKEFCGKPILAYSIVAALESGVFDEVMISTEDDEIAKIAQQYGASFPFRRSEQMASDYAMTIDVMLEVVDQYKKIGMNPESICCIYPTAPFITAEKLKKAYELFESSGADAVIPVVRFSFPPQRSFIFDGKYIKYKWKKYDLENYYHDAGQFYFLKTKSMIDQHTLVPEKTAPLVMDEMEVQDIDNMDDWNIAEIKYQSMIKGTK